MSFNVYGDGPWGWNFIIGSDATGTTKEYVSLSMTTTTCTITASGQSRSFNQDTESGDKPLAWVYPSDPTAETWVATVCHTNNMLYVALQQSGGDFGVCVWDIEVPLRTGKNGRTGIEWTSGDIRWNGFQYYAHHHDDVINGTGEDVNCPDCTCMCGTFGDDNFAYPPWRLRVDIVGGNGSCSCFDGGYAYFEPQSCDLALSAAENWWVCTSGTICGRDPSYHGFGMKINCGKGNWSEWEMLSNFCEGFEFTELYAEAVCSPFEMTWVFYYLDETSNCSWCIGGDPDSWTATATDGT